MQKTVDLGMAVFWGLIIAHTAQSYFVGAHPIFRAFCFGFVFLFFTIDTHLLKHNFCKSACPYAHLQKSFQRENSLHVSWEDRPGNKCGVCTACEQACYVDINVRETPFHLDCTMCGACIDACDRVFSRRPEPSLLQFAYNEDRSKQGIAGINSFPKAFICIAFVLFCSFFGWSVANRPRASFRIDYPASGTSEQLPVLEGGLHTNTFTVRVRSLSRKREKLTLALLDEGFEVEWVDPQDLVTTVAPFSRASARIKVRYTGEEELPPFTPIQFELTRSKSGQVIDRKELFFKPAPPCELDPLERQDVVPY